jgi:hypothetical protein
MLIVLKAYTRVVESGELEHKIEQTLSDKLKCQLASRLGELNLANNGDIVVDSVVEEVKKCVKDIFSSLQPSLENAKRETDPDDGTEVDTKGENYGQSISEPGWPGPVEAPMMDMMDYDLWVPQAFGENCAMRNDDTEFLGVGAGFSYDPCGPGYHGHQFPLYYNEPWGN